MCLNLIKSTMRTQINGIIHKEVQVQCTSSCLTIIFDYIYYLLVSHGKAKGTFNICIQHRSELVVLAIWYQANDVNLEKNTDNLYTSLKYSDSKSSQKINTRLEVSFRKSFLIVFFLNACTSIKQENLIW